MKKVTAGIAATMAFSGGGDINTASAEEILVNGKAGVSDTVKDSNEERYKKIMDNYEKGNYEEVLRGFGINPNDVKKAKYTQEEIIFPENPEKDIEEIRNKLITHIGSQEYLEKLKMGFNGDEERVRKVQEERKDNLNLDSFDLSVVDKKELGSECVTNEVREKYFKNIPLPRWIVKAIIDVGGFSDERPRDGYYYKEDYRVVIPKDAKKDSVVYELFHGSVKSDGISKKTHKILKDSYKKFDKNKIINPEKIKLEEEGYFEITQERIVRKQSLDLQMQKLGIKKYGEKFTEEYKKKMIDVYNQRKFSQDVNEFIETTNPDDFKKYSMKLQVMIK